MHYIEKEEVISLLDMPGCVPLMRDVLMDYCAGRVIQPLRSVMPIDPRRLLGMMPSANLATGIAGVKVLSVFLDNFQKGLPSHQGTVILFDAENGRLKALLDADAITGIRTAAVSAAATDALARPDAHTLCILGSGLQAHRHLEAIRLVRDLREVRVWDVFPDSVQRYKTEMEAKFGIPVVDCSQNVRAAVEGADIVCTVTSAKEPILFGAHVSPGTHINAVGACGAAVRELDTEAVRKGRLFCDSRESCMNEAGDLLIPLKKGELKEDHLLGEIGLVLSGQLPGRTSAEDITIFESQGLAVEDLAAASYVYSKYGQP